VRYSRIATKYTAIVALTLALAAAHDFNNLWIHPTGNCNSWHSYKVMILCNTSPNIVLGKNGSNRQSHKSTMEEVSKSNHIDTLPLKLVQNWKKNIDHKVQKLNCYGHSMFC
jgi:hypothetical protein